MTTPLLTPSTPSPVLAPPGQGLPPLEAFAARYLLFPITTKFMSDRQAIELLETTGQQILSLVDTLSAEQLTTPVLIKRFPGIEDSSRFWSVSMVIDHLAITGEAMRDMTLRLANGQTSERVVRTADVKPSADHSLDSVLTRYRDFLSTYSQQIEPVLERDLSTHRHAHPWFGPITAHQWLCLNGTHHRLHFHQIELILKQLAP